MWAWCVHNFKMMDFQKCCTSDESVQIPHVQSVMAQKMNPYTLLHTHKSRTCHMSLNVLYRCSISSMLLEATFSVAAELAHWRGELMWKGMDSVSAPILWLCGWFSCLQLGPFELWLEVMRRPRGTHCAWVCATAVTGLMDAHWWQCTLAALQPGAQICAQIHRCSVEFVLYVSFSSRG